MPDVLSTGVVLPPGPPRVAVAAAVPPASPICSHCGDRAVVQWQRRPTQDELAVLVAAEESRRSQALADADAQLPAPVFGPLPTAGDLKLAVFACGAHAIDLDHAAQVHAAGCSAPHPNHLPLCDCEPEPLPEPEPFALPTVTLPTGWIVPAPPAT